MRKERRQSRYISTGRLPTAEAVQEIVAEAHERFRDVRDGELSR
ncbi:MAG: glutaminase, partial [Actinobacteria bacterium]|nr:glutaminase [Actinomycetota bacterium]